MSDLIKARKGIFIPDITVEMFRNASLEAVEELLVSGEMQDIILPSADPKSKQETKLQATKASDCISRKDAINAVLNVCNTPCNEYFANAIKELPSVEPERLTDDDFETIRIHLNAQKEKLCNQQRWKEAEEYQRIIDRFMAFASAQLERKKGEWIPCCERMPEETNRYLVTNNRIGAWLVDIDVFDIELQKWYYDQNVVAWMPLSKPYEGEKK